MDHKTITRRVQKLAGLLIMLAGGGFWIWGWYTAINRGYYYEKASMFFPAVFILGLGLVLFPVYNDERNDREDNSLISKFKLLPPSWRAILIVALVAGFGNYLILSYLFS